ncbi:mannitol dehydrogenase family protein [uncultured Pseudokineococcus sp.]|uniref:mannitol dehydrogenase family protein n=1 Tax=uncultured Pseudokineococcus sp. TaxID=1642928 RepID=UPI00261AC74E|nr:mannitol dehydrogenase family protein [uncultured Pseudokineococcus sp.]
MDRLSLANLPRLAGRPVAAPGFDPRDVTPGQVHLGLGAFHRAHQALLTDGAMAASGDLSWGITGVSQRSRAVLEQLAPQDGLYGVLVSGRGARELRVGGAVRRVLAAPEQPEDVVAALADPATRVVTLTVTEKGYRHDPATGRLRTDDAEVAADLAGRPPRTAVGQLGRALVERARAGAGPQTVVCCDNLPGNGSFLRGLVTQFLDAAGADAAAALGDVAFPSSVVDRIVPGTREEDRAAAAGLSGLRDEGLVVAEPFLQWVVEDRFAGERPAWDAVGARLTADAAPFERAKLRVLNATHSLLAYLGLRAGAATVAEAVTDPAIERAARALLRDDALPSLVPPEGVDLAAYGEQVLERFANSALPDTTSRVAADGSQKLGPRLLSTARARRAAGAPADQVALAVAAWCLHVADPLGPDGRPAPLDDPLADRLREVVERSAGRDVVARLVAVLDPALAEDQAWVSVADDWFHALRTHGVRGALAAGTPS